MLDYFVSKKINFTYEKYVSLSLTTLARNSPLALAIAVTTFPGRELIILSLVTGPLIELPVLYIISKVLFKISKKY